MLRSWRSPTAPCPRTGRARWCRPRVVHGEDAALRWRARAIPPVRTRTAGVVARIGDGRRPGDPGNWRGSCCMRHGHWRETRSEEHTSELQSLMRISYAVFCLKKKNKKKPAYHMTDVL